MKPIAAEMEKSVLVKYSATMPPLEATGTPSSTMSVSRPFLAALKMRKAMSRRVMGTMTSRRAVVSRSWFISPAHSRCVS